MPEPGSHWKRGIWWGPGLAKLHRKQLLRQGRSVGCYPIAKGSKYINNVYFGPKVYQYDLLWAIWSPRVIEP